MKLYSVLLLVWGLSSSSYALKIIKKETSQKLEVIMAPSSKVPLVTICLAVRAGGMTEKKSTNGLTHLWEHMFFKGNKAIPSKEEFARRIRQLGITYNGDTSAEKVRYYFTLPSDKLSEGLEFMSYAIATPLLDPVELEKERIVVLDEYDRSASSPFFMLYNLNRVLRFGDKEYLRSPLGHRFLIEKATKKQLMEIKQEVMVPANSAILVAGDLDPQKTFALVEKYFKKWKNPKDWQPFKHEKIPPLTKTTSFVMTNPLVPQPRVMISYDGPTTKKSKKDTYIADVLISLLSHSSSKFYEKFIASGLTLDAGLSYGTQSFAGSLDLYASTQPEKLKEVMRELKSEPLKWQNPKYFNQSILEDVRNQLIVSHKLATNQPSKFILNLAFWWAIADVEYFESYVSELKKVTLQDVAQFSKKWFYKKPYIQSVILSEEAAKKAGVKDNSKKLVKKYLQAFLNTKGEK